MPSSLEIVIRQHNEDTISTEHSKPAISALKWLGMKVRRAGTCLATLVQPGMALVACIGLAVLVVHNKKCIKQIQEAKDARRQAMLLRSMSIATLHGGKMALERLIDAQKVRINKSEVDKAQKEMQELLSAERIDFKELHRAAAKLEMSGKEDHAIRMLSNALTKARNNQNSLEAYELEMLLVEILIYKGDFDAALGCTCLKDENIRDGRIPLYQAVIYILKGKNEYAKSYYEKFQNIHKLFHWPDDIEEGSPLQAIMLRFEEFEHVVENLKKEIEHARQQINATL